MSTTPTLTQLHRAVEISQQIEDLQNELSSLLGHSGFTASPASVVAKAEASEEPGSEEAPKRRGRPPGALAKSPKAPKEAKKGKRTMSAAHREAIAAAQRRRWAK